MKNTTHNRREYDPVISLRLPRDLVARFDAVEAATGVTRSALLRLALRRGLGVLDEWTKPAKPAKTRAKR